MEDNFSKYKSTYDNTKISIVADKKIKATLENLPSRKKLKKSSITAAVIIFIVASSLLLTTVYPAKALSIFKSVFGYFSKETNQNNNYDKYAVAVNKTVDDKGIKLTIDSIVSDSLGITLGYSIKSDSVIKDAYINITKVLVNGKEVSFVNSSSFNKEINVGEHVGYQYLIIKNLPENFKLEVLVSNIQNITGKWDFKLDTSSTETNKNTFFTNSSFEKVSKDGTINVSKVVSTPLSTFVELTYKSKEPIKSDDKIPFTTVFLMDQNNRMVSVADVNSRIVDEYTYHTEFYIKEYKGLLNKLTIIPYKAPEILKEARRLEDDNEFYDLKTKTPFVIKAGDLGSVTINSISETQDKVALNCSTDSIYGDWIINSLGLGYDIKLNAAPEISNFNPIWYNQKTMDSLKTLTNFSNFVLEYDKEPSLDKDKYLLVFQKYIEGMKIHSELEISIPFDN